jgi:hypothetical protein
MTSIRVYLIIATCMTGLSVGGNTARAQSRASLTTDPGAGATLTAEIDVVLATGPVSDTDTQTTNVTGSSVATLLPTDPPFDHAVMHTLDITGSPVTFDFCLIEFIGCLSGLQVTITDLNIVLLERTDGPIAANGDTTLPDTALAATGDRPGRRHRVAGRAGERDHSGQRHHQRHAAGQHHRIRRHGDTGWYSARSRHAHRPPGRSARRGPRRHGDGVFRHQRPDAQRPAVSRHPGRRRCRRRHRPRRPRRFRRMPHRPLRQRHPALHAGGPGRRR